MTRDEHIAEAEACLYRAMSRGTGQERGHPISATAEATIGLLHVALAAQKPTATPAPKPPVADTDWLKLEDR